MNSSGRGTSSLVRSWHMIRRTAVSKCSRSRRSKGEASSPKVWLTWFAERRWSSRGGRRYSWVPRNQWLRNISSRKYKSTISWLCKVYPRTVSSSSRSRITQSKMSHMFFHLMSIWSSSLKYSPVKSYKCKKKHPNNTRTCLWVSCPSKTSLRTLFAFSNSSVERYTPLNMRKSSP